MSAIQYSKITIRQPRPYQALALRYCCQTGQRGFPGIFTNGCCS